MPRPVNPDAEPQAVLVLLVIETSNTFLPEDRGFTLPLNPHPYWLVPENVPVVLMVKLDVTPPMLLADQLPLMSDKEAGVL